MTVVYSCDDNYAMQTGVSMLSLLDSNRGAEMSIYIISNGIGAENRAAQSLIAQKAGAGLEYIDYGKYEGRLKLDMEWAVSPSTYARLFIAEMLPESEKRALYLDSDTIICESLEPLWNMELNGRAAAGVADLIAPSFKEKIGLDADAAYVNAGVLLFDLDVWRRRELTRAFVKFIDDRGGRVTHHDQGTINGVLNGDILLLPAQYNAMTPLFTMRAGLLTNMYALDAGTYGVKEIAAAVSSPAILHFTPAFAGRPWETGCRHPRKGEFLRYKAASPWKDVPPARPRGALKNRMTGWLYRSLPTSLVRRLLG